jgi:hypothetical protein
MSLFGFLESAPAILPNVYDMRMTYVWFNPFNGVGTSSIEKLLLSLWIGNQQEWAQVLPISRAGVAAGISVPPAPQEGWDSPLLNTSADQVEQTGTD